MSENFFQELQPKLKQIAQCDYQTRLNLITEIGEFAASQKLTLKDCRIIWKALFYALWDQDKVIHQNKVSEEFAKLIYKFENYPIEWIKAGFIILNQEWTKIDYFRMNKFMYLVRRILTEMVNYLVVQKFTKKNVKNYTQILKDVILDSNAVLHMIQVQVQVILASGIQSDIEFEFLLEPFIQYLRIGTNQLFRKTIRKHIFLELVKQSDDEELPQFINLSTIKTKLFKFAAQKDIKQENRKLLYLICEELDTTSSNNNNNKIQLQNSNNWTTKKNLNKYIHCETKLKRLNKLDYLLKKSYQQQLKNYDEEDMDIDEDEFSNMLDEEQAEKLNLKMMSMGQNFEDDLYAQYYLQQSDEVFDYFPKGLSPKQLKELYPGLPIYYYYSAKQRKQYFDKLNQKYMNNLSSETNVSKPKHSRKVKFNLKEIKTKIFSSKDKISNSQKQIKVKESNSPGKSVLKPIDYEIQISNPLKTKRNKKINF